jgi:hypothetical protein
MLTSVLGCRQQGPLSSELTRSRNSFPARVFLGIPWEEVQRFRTWPSVATVWSHSDRSVTPVTSDMETDPSSQALSLEGKARGQAQQSPLTPLSSQLGPTGARVPSLDSCKASSHLWIFWGS